MDCNRPTASSLLAVPTQHTRGKRSERVVVVSDVLRRVLGRVRGLRVGSDKRNPPMKALFRGESILRRRLTLTSLTERQVEEVIACFVQVGEISPTVFVGRTHLDEPLWGLAQ